jgi:predicted MFS family arabinose efflux permease
MLVVIGLSSSAQPLLFAMTRAAVPREKTGKALSALNLAFFLGTALVQAATGPIASHWGIAAVFDFLAVLLLIGTGLFVFLTRPRLQDIPSE